MTKSEILELIRDDLPSVLNDKQKQNKVDNLLKKLKKQSLIDNSGGGRVYKWFLVHS